MVLVAVDMYEMVWSRNSDTQAHGKIYSNTLKSDAHLHAMHVIIHAYSKTLFRESYEVSIIDLDNSFIICMTFFQIYCLIYSTCICIYTYIVYRNSMIYYEFVTISYMCSYSVHTF